MPSLARPLLLAARARERYERLRGRSPEPREALIRRLAPGRRWLDVGCMWGIDGALCFVAEEAGAREVTGVDVMDATPAFRAQHAHQRSAVRFVRGDVNDPGLLEAVGVHDVVFCAGLLYHAPDPVATVGRLAALTGELLVLGCETLPEVPGLPGACVFYPALDAPARAGYRQSGPRERVGLDGPFDPARGYENWWWGPTPTALEGMIRSVGLEPMQRRTAGTATIVVATRGSGRG